MPPTDRRAFLSYVRDDGDRVDRLEAVLKAAEIPIWRDTADLWPGQDWRMRIREAITEGSFAFIACFSVASEARDVSGQREELTLAVDQLRLRRPGEPWIIPVRFDDIAVPDTDIGGGRTLRNLQWIDLFGDKAEANLGRLLATVIRITGGEAPIVSVPASPARFRDALRDPSGDMIIDDILRPLAEAANQALADIEAFPTSSDRLNDRNAGTLWLADLAEQQVSIVQPLIEPFVQAGTWALEVHDRSLAATIERVAQAHREGAGMTALLELQWFPPLPLVYAAGVAAVRRQNFHVLRALMIDARTRDVQDGRIPLIARLHPWRPFSQAGTVTQVLALRAAGEDVTAEAVNELESRRRGARHTPMSDFLRDILRPRFISVMPDDGDYDDAFDYFEVLFGLLAVDTATLTPERAYFDGPYYGRFTWRDRYARDGGAPERVRSELLDSGDAWQPLQHGLFGGSFDRAAAAMDLFIEGAKSVQSNQH